MECGVHIPERIFITHYVFSNVLWSYFTVAQHTIEGMRTGPFLGRFRGLLASRVNDGQTS